MAYGGTRGASVSCGGFTWGSWLVTVCWGFEWNFKGFGASVGISFSVFDVFDVSVSVIYCISCFNCIFLCV